MTPLEAYNIQVKSGMKHKTIVPRRRKKDKKTQRKHFRDSKSITKGYRFCGVKVFLTYPRSYLDHEGLMKHFQRIFKD